jgi:hypothetical protein
MRPQWRAQNVFFRSGEFWIYEDYLNRPMLTYFGPNKEHLPNPNSERNVRNAFWSAVRGDAPAAISMLVKYHQEQQIYRLKENGVSLIEAAVSSNKISTLQTILERFPRFAKPQYMHSAIDTGNIEMTKIFLARGTDPDDCVSHAIKSKNGSIELFDLLVSSGAEFCPCCMLYVVQPWTPVEIVANRLLPKGAECEHQEDPLFIEWLVQGGNFVPHMRAVAAVDPDAVTETNEHNWTPLMLAAGGLDPYNVECLLDLKADVNVYDDAGHWALDWCMAASDQFPEWYNNAYDDRDTPFTFEFDEEERSVNAELIRDMLMAAVNRSDSLY